MGLPARLLPHTVTRVRPASAGDTFGNSELDYGGSATRTTMAVWLQQNTATEPVSDGRAPLVGGWLLMVNDTIDGRDRFEWTGPDGAVVFEVDGPPKPVYTPAGLHHTECNLKVVVG